MADVKAVPWILQNVNNEIRHRKSVIPKKDAYKLNE
jgi:hypothetical protein